MFCGFAEQKHNAVKPIAAPVNNAIGKLYAQGGTNRINNVSDKRNIRSVAHCSAVGAVKREQRNNCADDPMHSPEEPEFSEKDSEYQRGHKRDNVKKDNLNTRSAHE